MSNSQDQRVDADRTQLGDPEQCHIVHAYLMSNSPKLKELNSLREQGWNNPEGESFFRRQRKNADKSNDRTAKFFYDLMQKVGAELHQKLSAFKILSDSHHEPRVLDLCVGPGGFLYTALKHDPRARAPLPEEDLDKATQEVIQVVQSDYWEYYGKK